MRPVAPGSFDRHRHGEDDLPGTGTLDDHRVRIVRRYWQPADRAATAASTIVAASTTRTCRRPPAHG
jgi:hypothetical protein